MSTYTLLCYLTPEEIERGRQLRDDHRNLMVVLEVTLAQLDVIEAELDPLVERVRGTDAARAEAS